MKPNWKKEPHPDNYHPPIIKRWELGVCTIEVEKLEDGGRVVILYDDANDWPDFVRRIPCDKNYVNLWALSITKDWFTNLPLWST